MSDGRLVFEHSVEVAYSNFGVLQRGLSHGFGGKNLKVELHSENPPGATYRITFDL